MPWVIAEAMASKMPRLMRCCTVGKRSCWRRVNVVVVTLPLVEVASQTVVGGVHADSDVVLLHLGPEGVELGKCKGAEALRLGTGAGRIRMILAPRSTTQSSSRMASVDDGQGDDRSGEDAVLVVEGPLLVHPLVESVHDDVGGLRVVVRRSSSTLARVGHMMARSTPCSSISCEARLGLEEGIGRADRARRGSRGGTCPRDCRS